MFGLFKNNKPKIIEKIYEAIKEEEKFLQSVEKDIKSNIDKFATEMDIINYATTINISGLSNNFYEKSNLYIEGASSREMFQVLNSISPDAKYDVENDYASGTVNGYRILMSKYKVLGKSQVGLEAKKYDLMSINNFIKDCINKYK